MFENSEKIRQLNNEYRRKDLSRQEKQEILKKIRREQYKADKRKPMSFGRQAFFDLIYGIAFILIAIVALYTNQTKIRKLSDMFFVTTLIVFVVMGIMLSRYKKEPADELAEALMTKATAYSAYGLIIANLVVGVIMSIVGGVRDNEFFTITGDHVLTYTYFLMGVYYVLRNAIYLWLDRTPASDEEE